MLTANENPRNILFIGPYRQNDGWGLAAQDYVLSLLETKHNIHCQPIYMSNNIETNLCEKIKSAENNYLNHYDVVIQNTLPMMMSKTQLYNIGLLFVENQNFTSMSINNLNLMDEIWVSSSIEKQSLVDGGVTKQIKVIGHPIDMPTTKNTTTVFHNIIRDNYKFYFIGEYIQRKNIEDIITAFYLEFDNTESVSLILKLSVPGLDSEQSKQKILNDISMLKKRLRVSKDAPKEIIITDRLSEDYMRAIHNECDCFVITSYGEAFCRPAADALLAGNFILSSSNIGILEYIKNEDKSIVESFPYPVILDNYESMGSLDIYNAEEIWYKPNIIDLRKKMRQIFNNRPKNNNQQFYKQIFSHKNIANIICSHIV